MEDSIDEKIMEYIEQGKLLFDRLIEDPKSGDLPIKENDMMKSILEI
jgi:hypothetical protein